MYSPNFQVTSSDISWYLCIIGVITTIITAIVLARLASNSTRTLPYTQRVATSLSHEEITKLVESSFSKFGLTVASDWKLSWPTPDTLVLSGYYLTDRQGCLAMLLSGILIGYWLIKYMMGRTEQVTIDFSKLQGNGELTLESKGIRAHREVDNLIRKLGATALVKGSKQVESQEEELESTAPSISPQQHNMSLDVAEQRAPVLPMMNWMICPFCKVKVLPKRDGTCPSCQSKILQ